jgi:hypothetical protein
MNANSLTPANSYVRPAVGDPAFTNLGTAIEFDDGFINADTVLEVRNQGGSVNPEVEVIDNLKGMAEQLENGSGATWCEVTKVAVKQALKDAAATFGASSVAIGVQTALRYMLAGSPGAAIPLTGIITAINFGCAAYQGQRLGACCGPAGRVIFGSVGAIVGAVPGALGFRYYMDKPDEMTKRAIALIATTVNSVTRDSLNGFLKKWTPSLNGAPEVVSLVDGKPAYNGKAIKRLGVNTGLYGVLSIGVNAPMVEFGAPLLKDKNATWGQFFGESLKVASVRSGVEAADAFFGNVTKKFFFPEVVKAEPKGDNGKEITNNTTMRVAANQFATAIGVDTNSSFYANIMNTFTASRAALVNAGDVFTKMEININKEDVRNAV